MDLPTIISALYPVSRNLTNYTVGIVGGAQSITYWDTSALGPQPTQSQLDAAWPAVELATAQKSQIETISAGCEASIIAGFTSSALGAAYIYPSKPTDQLNLLGEHSASMNPNNPTTWSTKFWCADANGVWDIRVHTAAQIQQVFNDGVARKLACIEQNKSLANQVMAATTVAAVQAIVWVSP